MVAALERRCRRRPPRLIAPTMREPANSVRVLAPPAKSSCRTSANDAAIGHSGSGQCEDAIANAVRGARAAGSGNGAAIEYMSGACIDTVSNAAQATVARATNTGDVAPIAHVVNSLSGRRCRQPLPPAFAAKRPAPPVPEILPQLLTPAVLLAMTPQPAAEPAAGKPAPPAAATVP